jgi:hypothetical protein
MRQFAFAFAQRNKVILLHFSDWEGGGLSFHPLTHFPFCCEILKYDSVLFLLTGLPHGMSLWIWVTTPRKRFGERNVELICECLLPK